MNMQYRQMRGSSAAGEEVTDPKDFFRMLSEEKFEETKKLFQMANDKERSQILDIFEGTDVFKNK